MIPRLLIEHRWIPVEEGQPEYEDRVVYWCVFQGYPLLQTGTVYCPDDFKPGNEDGITHWFPPTGA